MLADHHHETDEFDRGLQYDLTTLIQRRQILRMLGGVSLLTLISCGNGGAVVTTLVGSGTTVGSTIGPTGAATTGAVAGDIECEVVPEETEGPFPANGSNGPDVLSETGVVREDIRSSFGSLSGTADGVPLSIQLTVVDEAAGCTPLAGAAVYLWHCDREGN